MTITLKNGEKLNLEVNSLILEYIEEYDGGLEQLLKDATGQKDENGYTKTMYATNHLIYSIVASNYDKEITYRQAIRLIDFKDVEEIVNFISSKLPSLKQNMKNIEPEVKNKHRF